MTPRRVRWSVAIVLAAIGLAWATILARTHLEGAASPLDRLEALLLDARYLALGPRPAPEGVVVVAIDDDTVAALKRFPIARSHLAEIVDALSTAGVRAVALDTLLVDAGDAADDLRLETALSRAPAVIAAAAIFGRNEIASEQDSDVPLAARALWPLDRFGRAARTGFVNVATDHSGAPRHVPMMIMVGEAVHTSLVLQAALAGGSGRLTATDVTLRGVTTPLDLGRHLVLHFYGPRGTVRTVSALAVLRGEALETVKDRIALVGVTATGAGDVFKTPFDPVLPGVEVLASGVSHLVHGDGLARTEATRRVDAAAALVLAPLAALLALQRRIAVGLLSAAVLALAAVALATAAMAHGFWLSVSVPLAAFVPMLVAAAGARFWLDQTEERRLVAQRSAYRLFHSPALATILETTPDFLARPVSQRAGILFVDLSGFTGLSERLGPETTQALLVSFHHVVDEVITAQGGVVTAYMGDGAMALFGLPVAAPDDAARTIRAATELVGRIDEWIASVPQERRPDGVRVGAHHGDVVVSRLGGVAHQHITATGDSVNVASRLLALASASGAAVAFGCDLLDAADPEGRAAVAPGLGPIETVPIRGRKAHVPVRLWRRATTRDA